MFLPRTFDRVLFSMLSDQFHLLFLRFFWTDGKIKIIKPAYQRSRLCSTAVRCVGARTAQVQTQSDRNQLWHRRAGAGSKRTRSSAVGPGSNCGVPRCRHCTLWREAQDSLPHQRPRLRGNAVTSQRDEESQGLSQPSMTSKKYWSYLNILNPLYKVWSNSIRTTIYYLSKSTKRTYKVSSRSK